MTSDAQLREWIAESRAHRRQLTIVLSVFVVLAALVNLSSHRAALMMIFLAAVTAVSGFWVLAAHIADWQNQLARRQRGLHTRAVAGAAPLAPT